MALFFTDIDGTLLNPERTLSMRTIAAIRSVREAGHRFVLCSSRMPESMRILERLYDGVGEPLIAYNGALVLSQAGEIVHDVAIAPADARRVADYCEGVNLHASFFAGEDWHVWADDEWAAREINNTGVQPRPSTAREYVASGRIDEHPPHKVMCMGDPALIDGLEKLLVTVGSAVTYRSKDTYLEIANAKCSKASGVVSTAAELGFERSDCYFFGDNHNDLSAFAAVGTSIAVANGKTPVLEAASIITSRNHEDGVATYLEDWLRLNAA